jgi:hypothetical protein
MKYLIGILFVALIGVFFIFSNNAQLPYSNVQFVSGDQYARKMVISPFNSFPAIQVRQAYVLDGDRILYQSKIVDKIKNNYTLFVEGIFSVKGKKYSKSTMPLELTIFMKSPQSTFISEKQAENTLKELFSFPNTPVYKDAFTPVLGGNVTQFSWKEKDAYKEVRSIWITQKESQNYTIMFVACRIYKESASYEKGRCTFGE